MVSTSTIVVPWDDLPDGIPPVLHEVPQLGDVDPAEVSTVNAPVMVRLDRSGGLHLTSGRDGIVHCATDGTITGSTPLPAGHLADYAVNASLVVLLAEQQLRAMDHTGRPLWTIPSSFAGVLLGEHLFAPQRNVPVVHEIDVRSGATVRTLNRRPDAGRLFLVAGHLCAVYSDLDAGVRGIEVISADGAVVSTAYSTGQHFSWLVHPIGFDEQLSVYLWRDGNIARITLAGHIEELGKIQTAHAPPPPNQWQVTPEGRIVTALSTETGVTILTSG